MCKFILGITQGLVLAVAQELQAVDAAASACGDTIRPGTEAKDHRLVR